MGTALLKAHRREEGQSIVFVAIMLSVLILTLGLAVGVGDALVQYRGVSDAADLSALVGAQSLPCNVGSAACTTAETKACATAVRNGSDACTAGGTDSTDNRANVPPLACSPYDFIDYGNASNDSPGGNADCKASATGGTVTSYSYIEVSLTKTIQIPIFNVSVPLRSHAIAVKRTEGFSACAICLMNHTGTVLSGTGTATVSVPNGTILANSSDLCSIDFTGSAGATAAAIDNYGGVPSTGAIPSSCNSSSYTTTTPTKLTTQMTDPFPSLVAPSCTWTAPTAPTGTGSYNYSSGKFNLSSGSETIYPGTYVEIKAGSSSVLTLSPGTYCITGSFSTSSSSQVIGHNVLLYFTCGSYNVPTAPGALPGCTTPTSGGSLSLSGTGGFDLTAMTTGTYANMLIFYDRNDTGGLSLTGSTSNSTSVGTIYALSAPATLTGGSGASQVLDSALVVGSLTLTGSSTITIADSITDNFGGAASAALIQ